ncbi:MAG: alpha/beta fold hydrolase [Gemmatimonadetes bacterium]|nr:alpha/beta fold hydrolase [Gemmatimonadota bacterium]
MAPAPAVRYARTADGADIAYWRLGSGPIVLHAPNVQLGHLQAEWSVDGMRRWYQDLARTFTVVRYDHRGGGMSSRNGPGGSGQSIDSLVQDIETVAETVTDEPFVLLGWLAGALPAIAYAARHVQRVSHLVLWNGFARDATHGQAPRLRSLFEMAAVDWELFTESICQAALGWSDAAEARRWANVIREATTQGEFLSYLEARRQWDVTDEVSGIRALTLILYDPKNALASEERNRELAVAIPGARYLAFAQEGGAPTSAAVEAIRSFVGVGTAGSAELSTLTPKERQILGLVVEGATNAEIAERLFITVNTVTRHLTHIYAKTGTSRRAEAVRYGLQHGLGGRG